MQSVWRHYINSSLNLIFLTYDYRYTMLARASVRTTHTRKLTVEGKTFNGHQAVVDAALNNPYRHVYFAHRNNTPSPMKIGWSKHPEFRARQLQVGNANPLVVYVSYPHMMAPYVERALHKKYAKHRLSSEWFDIGVSTADFEYSLRHNFGRTFEILQEAEFVTRLNIDPLHLNRLLEFGERKRFNELSEDLFKGFASREETAKKFNELLYRHVPF